MTVYWKSLDELKAEIRSSPPRHQEFVEPLPWKRATPMSPAGGASRRDFLALMGFTLGAAACSRGATQHALPFAIAPEDLTPGVPNFYASTCGGCSASCNLIVKTRDGRPIKIEGNPEAPLFGGGTCAVGQATVLSLYDGARLRRPLWQGRPAKWEAIDDRVESHLRATIARGGRVVLLSGTITGPSTRDIIARWSKRYNRFQHVVYDAVSYGAILRAHQAAFNRAVIPHYRFDQAAMILGIEADFLGTWLSPVEFTAQYAAARQPGPSMAHHVQCETTLTLTGANADVRHAIAPSQIGRLALGLLDRVEGRHVPRIDPPEGIPLSTLDGLADQLLSHCGESLIACGVENEAVQTIVARLNFVLGNVGRTIELSPSSLQKQGDEVEMTSLVQAM